MVEQTLDHEHGITGRLGRRRWGNRPSGAAGPLRGPPARGSDHPLLADTTDAEHPWMPLSPCGTSCLPSSGEVPTVGFARLAARFTAAICVLAGGIGLALCLPVVRGAARRRAVRRWFSVLLRAFGVTLRVHGAEEFAALRGGVLFVSNHNSWLDVVALNAVEPVRCLAKREIRTWPVIGQLASSAGTVFVDRERLTQLPLTVARLAEVLRDGGKVNVFPEGTTWCGRAGGLWRPAAFQAAIDAGVPTVPVGLRYWQRDHGPSAGASFVGDQTLWDTLCRTLALRGLVVEVDVRPVLAADSGRTRRQLAAAAQQSVTNSTGPTAAAPVPRPTTASAAPRFVALQVPQTPRRSVRNDNEPAVGGRRMARRLSSLRTAIDRVCGT